MLTLTTFTSPSPFSLSLASRCREFTQRYSSFRPAQEKKYPDGMRVDGVLLPSLNMLQHPSATRSIASLGRSIPMPVRQVDPLYPRAPCSTADRPPIATLPSLHRAFYRRLCVLRQWQTDLNPPASPLSPTLDPLSRRGHRRLFSMTSWAALLFAPLNSYR